MTEAAEIREAGSGLFPDVVPSAGYRCLTVV